jgi:hypothetical protein
MSVRKVKEGETDIVALLTTNPRTTSVALRRTLAILRHFKRKATQQGHLVACQHTERAVAAAPVARMTPMFIKCFCYCDACRMA